MVQLWQTVVIAGDKMADERDEEIAGLKQRLAALENQEQRKPAPPKVKKAGCGAVILWGLLALVALSVIGAVLGGKNTPTSTVQSSSLSPKADSQDEVSTGNILNDALLKKSPSQQATILGKIVGEGCHGKRAFYDGIGHSGLADKQAFWSISCHGGKSYMVEISPDDKENKVLECSVMHAIHAGECFSQF